MKTLFTLILAVVVSACAGDTGDTGTIGVSGDQGLPGTDGTDGQDGSQGNTGTSGSTGQTGPQGDTGPTGDTGSTGPQGTAGSQGQQGAQGIPGPSLVAFNSIGEQLGYPIVIDQEDGSMMTAFHAHQEFAPASFPEGHIVGSKPMNRILYSGFNCTGQAYITAGSLTYDSLYVLGVTKELYTSSGTYTLRSVASFDQGTSCSNTGGSTRARKTSKTGFTIELARPWSVASF